MKKRVLSSRTRGGFGISVVLASVACACGPGAQGRPTYGDPLDEACEAVHSQVVEMEAGSFHLRVEADAPFRARATEEANRQTVVCAEATSQTTDGRQVAELECSVGTTAAVRVFVRANACVTDGESCLNYTASPGSPGVGPASFRGEIPQPGCTETTNGGAR